VSDNGRNDSWRPPNTPEKGMLYKEPLRPRFSILAATMDLAIPIAVFLVIERNLAMVFPFWESSLTLVRLSCLSLYMLARSKRIILWSLLLYQRFAPADVRNSCVFEPSCSEYTRLAIMKYGVVAGMCKGINRLLRCHSPNKGIDEP
jgi:putative component of membrane protein insertase Oxa1/YidC/SpoIIIJ protein YidD